MDELKDYTNLAEFRQSIQVEMRNGANLHNELFPASHSLSRSEPLSFQMNRKFEPKDGSNSSISTPTPLRSFKQI